MHGKSLVLALIDIDRMKWVNDQYGHQAGDLVLRQLCNMICSKLEHAISVGRFGGGEFSVIMHGPLHDAAELMNQISRYLQTEENQTGEPAGEDDGQCRAERTRFRCGRRSADAACARGSVHGQEDGW